MSSSPVRVLVIAGSPALRAGIAALLAEDPGIAAISGPDPRDESPAVIVLDAHSAGATPAEARAAWPGIPLVILEDGLVLDHADGLPAAWLGTDADAAMLSAAVRAVAAGLTVLDPERAHLSRPRLTGEPEPAGEALTAREREVLALVADGLPNKAIARELGISEHTAKFHVGSVLGKLGAASRAEAVAIATRRGMLSV